MWPMARVSQLCSYTGNKYAHIKIAEDVLRQFVVNQLTPPRNLLLELVKLRKNVEGKIAVKEKGVAKVHDHEKYDGFRYLTTRHMAKVLPKL